MNQVLTTTGTVNKLTIDTKAIQYNLKQIHSHLPPRTRVMAILKSSGYGVQDTVTLAETMSSFGIDLFGLAFTQEAIYLREAGIQEELVVMNPLHDEAMLIAQYDLQPVVSDSDIIRLFSDTKQPLKVHLNINTGMNRLGCNPDEALYLAKMIDDDPNMILQGAMTHFCSADIQEQDTFTHQQIKDFESALSEIKSHDIAIPWIHASNSPGTIRFCTPQFNLVRPGLAMYGIHLSECSNKVLPLKCALKLTSRLIGIHQCKKGETVGYGRTHCISQESALIGVIPLGYHDGIHRSYSNKAYVFINGAKAPLVGTICMDMTMVDVSQVPDVSVGDEVLIFGDELPPGTFAKYGGTIAHELISCLGPRIKRVFI